MRRLLVACVFAIGCGGDPPEPAPKKPAGPPAAAPAPGGAPNPGAPPPAVAGLVPAPPASKEGLLGEVRKRQLTNEDFVEGDTNRDPFRSYLATFAVQPPIVGKQHKIVLQKFALDELKLAAIVQGDGVAPRAMFIDPSGMGVNIVRGDHVSKADATVVRIAPDRVFFESEEDAGNGKTRKVERVVELHAGEVGAQ